MKTKILRAVLLVIAGAVMWGIARSNFAFPLSIPYSLAIAAAAGVLVDLLAMREFKSAQTTVNPLRPEKASALVRTGIFSKSRNPM